jgi:Ca-activated chloride channel family protein
MSLTKIFIALGFIAFATLSVIAQTCAPDQRKELLVTAVDKDGNVFDKLRAEHLRLKVGDSPATISDVVFQMKYPLDLAVLIDASISQETVLSASKAAARAFLESVVSPGQDRVAIVSFSDRPDYLQVLASDLRDVAALIDRIKLDIPPGYVGGGVVMIVGRPPRPGPKQGSTSLWDVVSSATTELFGSTAESRRRAMVLFTDGVDTSSSGKFNTMIQQAIKHNVAVFSIGVGDSSVFKLDEQALKRLSKQTGGVAEFPGKKKDKLEAVLTKTAKYLRGTYVVGYCGGAVKDRAKLQLEVVDPEMRKAKPALMYKRY